MSLTLLIIEDEAAAAEHLKRLILQVLPDAQVHGPLDSIESSVAWLAAHPAPDLIFLDIQLADGHSFDIFGEVTVSSPVIFTTAYDQHALTAFKHNGIEYLLKPVKQTELQQAIEKFQALTQAERSLAPEQFQGLLQALKSDSKQYQKRLVIRYGQHIKALELSEAAYFFIESKVTILRTHEGKEFPVDQNLEELQQLLDPQAFFRINRKMIVNIAAIRQMLAHSKSRVRLDLQPPYEEEVIVSAERSPEFKEWLKGVPGR